jgi:ribosomal protein L11 methyltransferase
MSDLPQPRYPYVAVEVVESEADEASERLFELGALGIEQRDGTTLVRSGGESVVLVASFEDHESAVAAAGELPEAWSPRVQEVVGDAWRDEWKKHFAPFSVCPGVVVRPPWRGHEPAPGEHVIELEPGRAFGTGLHETTSLVAEILAERAASIHGKTILDVGCGSGILSLVALVLGAARAVAIDVDPDAVDVTRENAERNGMAGRIDASTSPLEHVEGTFPVVVANIEARTLVELAAALAPRVERGGWLVLSGILSPAASASQQDDVARAYPLALEEVRTKGEWIAMVLRPW